MNTLKIYLKDSGSTADVDVNFRLFKNGYRNAKLDVYVPTSLTNVESGFQIAVKTGAILVDTNGKKVTTEPFGLLYNRTETVNEIEYKVYQQDLPALYLAYAGNQTIVANVVIQAISDETVEQLVTSQEVVITVLNSAYLEDEPLYPTQEEQIWGALNELAENKEDKVDTDIEVSAEKIVTSQRVSTAINNLNDKVTTNTGDIDTQSQAIADLSHRVDNVERNENPIGQMTVTTLPTDEQLDAFVLEKTGRSPKYNDVITVVLDNDGVFTTYKYYYSIDDWQHYQLSVEAKAENDIAGLVEGTEGIVGYNQPISANIVNGQIVDLKYKNNNNVYTQIGNAIDSNKGNIANIISGSQVVGEAVKATEDSNGDNIAQTYAQVSNVYTKSQSDMKYLPKSYTNVYYYSADGFVDDIPTEPADGVQFTANVPQTGEVQLAECERTLETSYHFTRNSTDESRIWLMTDTNTTLQIRMLTYVQISGVDTLLASQLTSDIEFVANEPKEIILDSIYNSLGNQEIDVVAGDTYRKEIYVTSTDNTASEIELISSLQYASSFNLAVQSIIFNINTINGIKQITIQSTDWTDNGDGTYSVVISQLQHQQAPTNRYVLELQQEISSGVYEYIAFTPEVDIDGNITITSQSAIDCVLLIASAVTSNTRGVLTLENPTELNIDYEQVGAVQIIQTETATALSLNAPADTSKFFTVYVANREISTENISVNGQTITPGQSLEFMWTGTWVLAPSSITTGDVYDNVNQQALNNTLLDLQTQINGKQNTLTFDNTPTQDSTNPVTSGGVYSGLSGKEDISNKVTSLSSASTDTEYPSAKCVYDLVGDIDTILQNINNGGGV